MSCELQPSHNRLMSSINMSIDMLNIHLILQCFFANIVIVLDNHKLFYNKNIIRELSPCFNSQYRLIYNLLVTTKAITGLYNLSL